MLTPARMQIRRIIREQNKNVILEPFEFNVTKPNFFASYLMTRVELVEQLSELPTATEIFLQMNYFKGPTVNLKKYNRKLKFELNRHKIKYCQLYLDSYFKKEKFGKVFQDIAIERLDIYCDTDMKKYSYERIVQAVVNILDNCRELGCLSGQVLNFLEEKISSKYRKIFLDAVSKKAPKYLIDDRSSNIFMLKQGRSILLKLLLDTNIKTVSYSVSTYSKIPLYLMRLSQIGTMKHLYLISLNGLYKTSLLMMISRKVNFYLRLHTNGKSFKQEFNNFWPLILRCKTVIHLCVSWKKEYRPQLSVVNEVLRYPFQFIFASIERNKLTVSKYLPITLVKNLSDEGKEFFQTVMPIGFWNLKDELSTL